MTDPVPTPIELHISHAVLKAQIETLETKVDTLTKTINELVAIKNKGMGAFWLASIILATAFTTVISAVGSWLRGN